MKKYIFIGIGGALGAILRFVIKNMNLFHYNGAFPVNTLMINISGSFVLALILTIFFEIWRFNNNIRLGIAVGFLGAYTTFSTMCKETVQLLQKGMYISALSYITLSVLLGLLFASLGTFAARSIIPKISSDDFEEDEADVS